MLKANFKLPDMQAIYKKAAENIEKSVIDRFIAVGESFIENAIANGTYQNITGNLRGSIGFMVTKNSFSVHENFGLSGTGTEGSTKAILLAEELAIEHPKGVALIVVAGEDYAAYVESKGRDVLTASSLQAKADLFASLKTVKLK